LNKEGICFATGYNKNGALGLGDKVILLILEEN
jgi:hypothetical protein